MAGSVNKVILVGNLGRDPEIRHTSTGKTICNLNLATSEHWTDKQTGERKEKTEWHRVVIFSDALSNIAERYLKKGSKIYLEGSLQTRKWVDQGGVEKYSTEVVLQGFNGVLTMLDSPRQESHHDTPQRREPPAIPMSQRLYKDGDSREKSTFTPRHNPNITSGLQKRSIMPDRELDDDIPF